jgi:hypothetical protein
MPRPTSNSSFMGTSANKKMLTRVGGSDPEGIEADFRARYANDVKPKRSSHNVVPCSLETPAITSLEGHYSELAVSKERLRSLTPD